MVFYGSKSKRIYGGKYGGYARKSTYTRRYGRTKVSAAKKLTPKLIKQVKANIPETMYCDHVIKGIARAMQYSPTTSTVTAESTGWTNASYGTETSITTLNPSVQSLLSWLWYDPDSTVGTKDSRSYNVKNIMIKANITANTTENDDASGAKEEQGGEQLIGSATEARVKQYLRTTYRLVLVEDLNKYTTKTNYTWSDVFADEEYPNVTSTGQTEGVFSYRNVNTLSRYRVVSDRTVELSADNPSKVLSYYVPNPGRVRMDQEIIMDEYVRKPSKTYFFVWASCTNGILRGENLTVAYGPTVSWRTSYTDA